MNSADIAEWVASPGIRAKHAENGALLVHITDGHHYALNRIAARILAAIMTSPAGIAAQDLVDVLDTHFDASRQTLQRETLQCLAYLERTALIHEKNHPAFIGNETPPPLWQRGVQESQSGGCQIMLCQEPYIETLETIDSLVDHLLPQRSPTNMDWRAKKLKDYIDTAPRRLPNLGVICGLLQISLSARQARRLFKNSTGISIREYSRRSRLVFAARQLQSTEQPIKAIATDAGYQTPQGFEKGFHDMFQLTPAEFRRMWHENGVSARNEAFQATT